MLVLALMDIGVDVGLGFDFKVDFDTILVLVDVT